MAFEVPALMLGISLAFTAQGDDRPLNIAGVTMTPHVKADSMRYTRPPESAVGARVQLFLRNEAPPDSEPLALNGQTRILFDGKSPTELLAARVWSWHDTPAATLEEDVALPSGALTVWTFNGLADRMDVEVGPEEMPWLSKEVSFDRPACWLSAVTFLGPDAAIQPDTMVVHIANESDSVVEIRSCRLWLPRSPKSPRVFFPQPPTQSFDTFNGHAAIPAKDRGGFIANTGPLPLTYAVIEVSLAHPEAAPFSVWGHLRIKTERFDISGGWVNDKKNCVASEVFLKALKRLHVNTAHLGVTPGYSDTELYARYPLKYFNKLTPFETYDKDEMLPRIHAVEFLGEPQYGGGRPVPPQEVWEKLHPYATTRLATTVTHSDERVWRDYAGLSDFPHYDAYRVSAPSADAWRHYDRWGGQRIGWGAPLETIGDMCRSLRELNRPMPCAVWSQGPHDGWEVYGGRKRTSPTPDEIRLQAYHAVSTRITSLYWFNLSINALVMWRDTLDELGRIGRELRMLDEFLLEGDAYGFERLTRGKGQLDWDVASVCGPRAALLFALDLDYAPDANEKVFRFGPPRKAKWCFPLPAYLQGITDVFRVDADGVYDAKWSSRDGAVEIRDEASRVAIYIAARDPNLRTHLEDKRRRLIAVEAALQFEPARDDADFALLEQLAASK